jgi:hypothetical protein
MRNKICDIESHKPYESTPLHMTCHTHKYDFTVANYYQSRSLYCYKFYDDKCRCDHTRLEHDSNDKCDSCDCKEYETPAFDTLLIESTAATSIETTGYRVTPDTSQGNFDILGRLYRVERQLADGSWEFMPRVKSFQFKVEARGFGRVTIEQIV